MIFSTREQKIWLVQHRVDFRKAHNGLLAEAYKLNLDPFNGDILIFIGRNRRKVKVLHADKTGIWVSAKMFTLGAMKTQFRFLLDPCCTEITSAELAMLTEGSKYILEKKLSPLHYQLTQVSVLRDCKLHGQKTWTSSII